MITKKNITLSALALALSSVAIAAPQDFATTYNSNTLSKGTFEFENKLLWNHNPGADQFKFQHEFEYGVTDRLQIAAFTKWEHERVSGEGNASAFTSAGVEATYQLANPNNFGFGSTFTLEAAIGDVEAALEAKFNLQKNIDNLILAYNISVESVWAGANYDENVAEFQQSIAVGYKVSPKLIVGVEAVHAGVWADWKNQEENGLFVGPSVGLKLGSFWTTLGAQWQVTNDAASADVRGVITVGYVF